MNQSIPVETATLAHPSAFILHPSRMWLPIWQSGSGAAILAFFGARPKKGALF
jgi:hypothetical protein